jgi:hypothetical protein
MAVFSHFMDYVLCVLLIFVCYFWALRYFFCIIIRIFLNIVVYFGQKELREKNTVFQSR